MFIEIVKEAYLFSALLGCCAFLGTVIIRQDRSRITKVEDKQEKDHTLLSKIDGKIDMILRMVNGCNKQ